MGTRKRLGKFAAAVFLVLVPMGSGLRVGADTPAPPAITIQPDMGLVARSGDSTSFYVAATGSPTPAVQWQESTERNGPWSDVVGGSDPTLNVTTSAGNLGHAFRAVFTNLSGSVASRPARLVSRQQWMHDLGSDIDGVPLTQLTIPGTHDTGTYGLIPFSTSKDHQTAFCEHGPTGSICASYAKAQSRKITDELDDGIRYFDLRACGNGDLPDSPNPPDFVAISEDPVTCHQMVAARVAQILQQTRTWVDAHPTEVVFMDFNHEFQVDPDTLATQIENAFKLTANDDRSLMIPPQYCNSDPTQGICAGNLDLRTIANRGLGNVIVNFMNDGTPGQERCFPHDENPSLDYCDTQYRSQHGTMPSFYYIHRRMWGLTWNGLTNMANCTVGGAEATCFGNDYDIPTVLPRSQESTTNRQTFAEPHPASTFQHFFVQFLQTTPDGGYIADHKDGSLLDMARTSNPIIGPAFFGCPSSWSSIRCFAATRPENVNIVALNFYDITDYSGWGGDPTFDFVKEVISFNEYARTAPVVTVVPAIQPASTGWYNAATLGGQGHGLKVNVAAADYRYPTGIKSISCYDTLSHTYPLADVGTTDTSMSGDFTLGDGGYVLTCDGEDGANQGTLGYGNHGSGPGSSNFPRTIKVDTTPPQIHCPGSANYVLNQPVASLSGLVTDDTSGPATSSVATNVSTSTVGNFNTTLTASDVAGNTASAVCAYTVSYAVGLRYDSTRASKSGSAVNVKVELDDYSGNPVLAPVAVTATSVTDTGSNTTTAPTAADKKTGLAFNAEGQDYKYELKTSGLAAGNYSLDFVAGADPLAHHAPFILR